MRSLSRIPIRVVFEEVGEYHGEFIRFYAPIKLTVEERKEEKPKKRKK